MWRVALKATVYGVSTDALLLSRSGTPLVHRYHVFGRGGMLVSLRGDFISHIRAFTVQADADGWLAWKRDSEWLFQHRFLICASAADRSSPARFCRQGFHPIQTSVYVGRDAGVSGFSHFSSLSISVPRSGCYFV